MPFRRCRVQVDIASHSSTEAPGGGRIPSGLEFWSVDVDITQLEVVFLYRFLQVGGAVHSLALRPACAVAARQDCAAHSLGPMWLPSRAKTVEPHATPTP